MAKIRVYELARELNMTNKVLIEKILSMGIPIKSHMSSLEDENVDRIKAELFAKKPEEVVETRVKATVIRRRRRVVAPTDAPTAEEVEPTPEAAEQPAAEKQAPAEEAVSSQKPVEAATEATEETTEAAEAVPPEAPSEAANTAAEEPVPEAEDQKPVPEAEKATETPQEDTAAQEMPPAEKEPPQEKEAAEETASDAAEAKPRKLVRPKHKSEPAAKIIKLPVKPVEPPAPKKKTPAAPPAAGQAGDGKPAEEVSADADLGGKDAKKKRRKRKVDDADRDKKFFKKKITFRKKAVVEGADLYDSGLRGRKGRKGAKGKAASSGQKTQITTAKAIKRRIKIDETIVLSDLAKRMGIKANEMIKTLMNMGVMATVNQTIDFETAVLVAAEFNYEVERASFEESNILKFEKDDPEQMAERPPVVTIMGHVDHGKTSLLDVIRKTRVTSSEAGGITQHIGAYYVDLEKGQIVFLDTPGHEAFTAMRSRGAQVTDIVVLVVAADDGVMPQTLEAINHARASKVPIIVAINKIDKANADPDRVLRELADQGLAPEEWGGDTIFVKVSAKQNQGIDDLLEMILLQAELLELKANPNKLATGHVVEAKLDSGRGPVATVLVNDGTLHAGDAVVCGIYYGKVRAMLNDRGVQVEAAGPSVPVEVIGLSGVPMAGDDLVALDDEKDAKQVSLHRIQKQRSKDLAKTSRMSLEGLFEKMKEGEIKDLNLIIKADVDGSIEALRDSLVKLSNEEVKINVVHAATGTITESDVSLATVSNAIIIGFNVRPSPKVQTLAAEENVDMRFHNVIYDVIKEIKNAIVGLMASRFEERVLGRAEVREVFHVPKVGAIAGCYVTDGKLERGRLMRLLRDGVVRYEGKNSSLRRFKDDVKEVNSGYECGVGIENYNDIKVGDVLECYYMEEIKPEME